MGINRYIYGMFDVYGCVYRYLWYRKPHKDRTRTDSYRPKYCSVVNYRLAAFFGVCWALPKINGAPTVVGCFIVFSFLFQIWRRAAWPMWLFLHGTVGSKPLSSFILNIVYMLLHVFVCVCVSPVPAFLVESLSLPWKARYITVAMLEMHLMLGF